MTSRALAGLILSVAACFGISACSSASSSQGGTGGAIGKGGATVDGGSAETGGSLSKGGTSANGTGGTGSGGSNSTGGTSAAGAGSGGSVPGNGGAVAVGGSGGTGAGGTWGSGGMGQGGAAGSSGLGTGGNSGGSTACLLPSKFKWTSSAALITPPSGAVSIKDPSVAFFENKWHIFATAYTTNWTMVYLNFDDWAKAGAATKTMLNTNSNLSGYKCAPQIFYFRPTQTYYLLYQTQPPAYSTSKTPSDVKSWSAMTQFWTKDPSVVTDAPYGSLDYWIICDDVNCHMFFSGDNGSLYRASTPKAKFPSGMDGKNTVVVMKEKTDALYEAANVYTLKGLGKYLLLVEARGNGRYFRSWTADKLDGIWTALADKETEPFAGKANVAGADWASGGEISHGEILRDNPDETMTIDPCTMKYLYQGLTKVGDRSQYSSNEYSLGLLMPAQ